MEVVIGLISTVAFEFFPVPIISLFGSESALYIQFAIYSFRIFLATMTLCCVQKATCIFLQSLGKPLMSLTLSLLRDFILSVPLVLFLPECRQLGVMGPLYSGPIADVVSFTAAMIMMVYVWKQLSVKRFGETAIHNELVLIKN